jgi:anti-sigma factor RsiW
VSDAHVREDLGIYALGLLEGDERAAVERHLAGCAACRADLAAEEATVAELAAAVARAPSRDLRGAIVATHRPSERRAWRMPRLVVVPALAAAVLAAVALAVVEQVVPLEPKGISGSASVIVARGGGAFLLLAVPSPPAGKAYEAWVIRDGSAIPAGLAPAGRGLLVIALEVSVLPGDVAAVTIEQAAGVRAPTSDPVLIGARGRT